jgi:hypothetical protein
MTLMSLIINIIVKACSISLARHGTADHNYLDGVDLESVESTLEKSVNAHPTSLYNSDLALLQFQSFNQQLFEIGSSDLFRPFLQFCGSSLGTEGYDSSRTDHNSTTTTITVGIGRGGPTDATSEVQIGRCRYRTTQHKHDIDGVKVQATS